MKRRTAYTLAAVAALALLLLASFAMPVRLWRTGEQALPPLDYEPPGSAPALAGALWIDTDAACGLGPRRDPDDCLALLALLQRLPRERLAGVASVFGNAPQPQTHAVVHDLLRLAQAEALPLHAGCRHPLPACRREGGAQAVRALSAALHEQPLVVLALGPLTHLALVLQHEPALAARVRHVVAVMGRRPGHLFHPAEGRGEGAMLLGHGPVFRDLNAELDIDAVRVVLDAGVPLTLVPYAAARDVLLTSDDLDQIARRSRAGIWVARRSRGWLAWWRDAVGLSGFYPFDLMAAALVIEPSSLQCARVHAWVGRDPLLLWPRRPLLLVTQDEGAIEAPLARGTARYCDKALSAPRLD